MNELNSEFMNSIFKIKENDRLEREIYNLKIESTRTENLEKPSSLYQILC